MVIASILVYSTLNRFDTQGKNQERDSQGHSCLHCSTTKGLQFYVVTRPACNRKIQQHKAVPHLQGQNILSSELPFAISGELIGNYQELEGLCLPSWRLLSSYWCEQSSSLSCISLIAWFPLSITNSEQLLPTKITSKSSEN